MAEPLLQTRDLSMHFGGVKAVRNVSFTLAEGELCRPIEPLSAWKKMSSRRSPDSFSRTLQALIRGDDIPRCMPTRSRGWHRHRDPGAERVRWLECARKHLAGGEPHPCQRARQCRGRRDAGAYRAHRRAAGRLVGQLAHGQRQWVELGIVLSTDPDLILLDEPAAGMTHEEVNKTAELVREINRSKALIVVEHDMQFIRMIAKQVTVFNQGSVLVEDAVENILRNPLVRDIYLGKQAAA